MAVKPVEFLVRMGDTENAGRREYSFRRKWLEIIGNTAPSEAVQMLAQSLIDGKGRKG